MHRRRGSRSARRRWPDEERIMNKRIAARVFGLALGVAVAALTGTGTAQQLTAATPAEIAIDNFAFEPAVLTIAPGTQVTWINRDEEPHTVVSVTKEQPFKSQALDTNDKSSLLSPSPATYKYFSSPPSSDAATISAGSPCVIFRPATTASRGPGGA